MSKAEQGLFQDRYKVIPRCLIFVERNETEILLIKGHAKKRLWANQYNAIGGHIEPGEDILGAARRELFEETGLNVPELWLCGNIMIDAGGDIGITIFVFKGEFSAGEIKASDEGELSWVSIHDFGKLPLVEDLHVLLPKVMQMERGENPFAALYTYDESEELQITFGITT